MCLYRILHYCKHVCLENNQINSDSQHTCNYTAKMVFNSTAYFCKMKLMQNIVKSYTNTFTSIVASWQYSILVSCLSQRACMAKNVLCFSWHKLIQLFDFRIGVLRGFQVISVKKTEDVKLGIGSFLYIGICKQL